MSPRSIAAALRDILAGAVMVALSPLLKHRDALIASMWDDERGEE